MRLKYRYVPAMWLHWFRQNRADEFYRRLHPAYRIAWILWKRAWRLTKWEDTSLAIEEMRRTAEKLRKIGEA